MGKDSFVLYDDYWEHIKGLTDKDKVALFTAIFAKRGRCAMPELSGEVKMAFSFIRAQLDRDAVKYDAICERNRGNIAKRYATKSTSGRSGIPNLPVATKSTDTDTEPALDIEPDDD